MENGQTNINVSSFDLNKSITTKRLFTKIKLTASARLVLRCLVDFWNPNKGLVHPGQKIIAECSGVSLRSVNEAIDELRKNNIILTSGSTGEKLKYFFTPYFFELLEITQGDTEIAQGNYTDTIKCELLPEDQFKGDMIVIPEVPHKTHVKITQGRYVEITQGSVMVCVEIAQGSTVVHAGCYTKKPASAPHCTDNQVPCLEEKLNAKEDEKPFIQGEEKGKEKEEEKEKEKESTKEKEKEKEEEKEKVKEEAKKKKEKKEKFFEEFWVLYPKKVEKKKSGDRYGRALDRGILHGDIMAGLNGYIRHIKSHNIEPEFIKHPTTWLNNECWNDEYSSMASGKKKCRIEGLF